MSDETNDNDADRHVVPINEYQRRLCDSLVELATFGEGITSFARVLHGAIRDGEVAEFPQIRAMNKRLRTTLEHVDRLMLEVERNPPK